MGQLIIFEGPDGAGKTTLAKSLMLKKETQYMNNGPYTSPHHAYEAFFKQFELAPLLMGTMLIDRCHYSEEIYSIAHKRDMLSEKKFEQLDEMIIEQNGIVVLCLPPYRIAYENWAQSNSEGKEYLTKESMWKEVYNAYCYYTFDSRINVLLYDYSNDSVVYLLTQMEEIFNAKIS